MKKYRWRVSCAVVLLLYCLTIGSGGEFGGESGQQVVDRYDLGDRRRSGGETGCGGEGVVNLR